MEEASAELLPQLTQKTSEETTVEMSPQLMQKINEAYSLSCKLREVQLEQLQLMFRLDELEASERELEERFRHLCVAIDHICEQNQQEVVRGDLNW